MNGIEIQSMITEGVPTGSVQTTHMTSMAYSLSNIKYLPFADIELKER